jgi:hypothetical protein
MIGLVTQEARDLQTALVEKARRQREGLPDAEVQDAADADMRKRPRQPKPEDDSQLTPAHEQARAFMRSLTDEGRVDEDDDSEDIDKSGRILPDPANSPGGDVRSPGPFPNALAHRGGRVIQGVHMDFVDLQDSKPKTLASLQTASPNASGSSLHSDGREVAVQSLDHATTSANQELPGRPSAKPGQPAFAPASSGYGQRPARPRGGRRD